MSQVQELVTFVKFALNHPSPWPNRARALVRFGYRQAHKRVVGRPLRVRWEGLDLEVHANSTAAAAAFYFGWLDFWEFSFLRRFLRAGDCVADVGANVGIYSMFLAKLVGPSGTVLACEPEPTNAGRLRGNIERNGLKQVRVIQAAIGNHEGIVKFSAGQDCVGHIVQDGGGIDVKLSTLDDICVENTPIYVKVDVEGFEEDVVRGATRLLERDAPLVWQMELIDLGPDGARKGLERLLADRGYKFVWYDPKTNELVSRDVRHPVGNNLLAVHDLAAVCERLRAPG